MNRIIKNSGGKRAGELTFEPNQIIINSDTKPLLIIEDKELIDNIINKPELKTEISIKLYDEYELTYGEIAAIFNVCYANINRSINKLVKTSAKHGRRNSHYGKETSTETKNKISKSLMGKSNWSKGIPKTTEQKIKISNSLKLYYQTHEVSQETKQKLSQAWKDGKYKNSPMGRGISGHFYSIKNHTTVFFRSILELEVLVLLEQDARVQKYIMEPFVIDLVNGHRYTPDVLVNDKILLEIKSKRQVELFENKERFYLEQESANNYCQEHNLVFQIIYDTDLPYISEDYRKMVYYNPQLIEPYKVQFSKQLTLR